MGHIVNSNSSMLHLHQMDGSSHLMHCENSFVLWPDSGTAFGNATVHIAGVVATQHSSPEFV